MYWNKEGREDLGSLIRKHTLFFTDMFLFSANHFFSFSHKPEEELLLEQKRADGNVYVKCGCNYFIT